jgi:zinc/manganese transport system substrate-binding protein
VAAENFWGSIAAQLGGQRVAVQSIITNPSTDPHSYEPTAADGRAVAGAELAIVNGIGYDEWMPRLLDASPAAGRRTLTVGGVLGLTRGENPHQWYSPASVRRVSSAITAEYVRLRPSDRSYFEGRERLFQTRELAAYNRVLEAISARYAGVPVGYSESIFAPLGGYLGLELLTPASFAKAVAEGTEVSAADTEAVEAQAREHKIEVWVYNSQNATPEVQRATALARDGHIPIVTLSETLAPASASFAQWQVAELERLRAALHEATGR